MAKQTYRHKHADKIGVQQNTTIKKYPPLHPELQQQFAEGKVLLIDKPLHWTSFDVVRKLRNALQIKKIGHAGTLDPLATGLLIVCTGKFTKKINEYMAREKVYTGHITLGATTPTYDLESTPEHFKPFDAITPQQIKEAAQQFIGSIQQYPPVFSAIKKDGVALYELARRGEAVDLKPRSVSISSFEITGINLPELAFRVRCSTGTYIRSLAHDFGQALHCGAYLSSLRRTHIGDFDVKDASTVNDFIHSLYPATDGSAGGNMG
ncbi:MAG TPA: tRNA pseudouridine(55) synthase TruB [Ferruginibacter sp.]|nr:tRNA pseudouridine(55) synthase TruB [Ferruginibacter sp.]HMP20124.1 tRNA pseudouridine(55) synthase TruB [Ferruginibacter sp.]